MPSFRPRFCLRALAAAATALGAASLLGACQPAEKPGVFGGQGAKVATLDEKPLPASAGNPEPLGPCGKNGPISDTALVDDFEDGNDRIFKRATRFFQDLQVSSGWGPCPS